MLKTIICGAVLVAATSVTAQDYNAAPTYGTTTLTSGFTPDPQVVNLQSGGTINATNISSGCSGYIANAPDVRLNFTGGSLPLIISVTSTSDTTLIVNGPDGQWYCDDDSGVNGLNPMVRFNKVQSGRYDIWVGTYGSGTLQAAQLQISEVTSQ
jgi:hypothetical protein